ncbi:MAG: DUF1987 domain-containing protein [Desulfobacteraceae bacterium]|nr:DUF1987 domain-containing protein [Desulfobacteraceae bacterium]
MEHLKIEATKHTPGINYISEDNTLEITGMSYPSDAADFYTPFFDWVENYLELMTDQKFTVNIELSYLNSSSSKIIWDFFEMLEQEVDKEKNISVNWIYDEDDDDKLELGEDFKEDFESLPFNLVKKNEV